MSAPRVMLVGGGAIGGIVAARLVRAGHEVQVVDTDVDHVARLRDPGLVVEGDHEDAPTPLDARTPDDAEVTEPVDLLLLAVRSQHTLPALTPWLQHLAADGDVVSLQNGLNEEHIADMVGTDRVVGCVVGFGATWVGPGRVELTSDGELVLGRLDGSSDPRLERAREVLAAAFRTRVVDDITGERWAKMLVNTVTVLGAIGGVLTGELLASEAYRPIIHQVLAEAVAVAAADGERPANVWGVDPDAINEDRAGWTDELDGILEAVAPHIGAIKSVTWRDLELGRPTEVDAVTGEIVRRAETNGVAVPVNAAALDLLRALEAGERRPIFGNLHELASIADRA